MSKEKKKSEKTSEQSSFNSVISGRIRRTNIWTWNLPKKMTQSTRTTFRLTAYNLILAQVYSECWHLRVVRNPESAAYSRDFSDTVFTRHEEVGTLPQTALYIALSIISHSIHGNGSTAGGTVWTAKLWKDMKQKERSQAKINGIVCCWWLRAENRVENMWWCVDGETRA